MTLAVGASIPDFDAQVEATPFHFGEWPGADWALVFAFKSMSPTCTTELVALTRLHDAFRACGARVLGVSIDTPESVAAWLADVQELYGCTPPFPLISDPAGEVAASLDLFDTQATAPTLLRTAYLVTPERRVAVALTYPVTNGRNFDEILRILKAAQLTASQRVATSATWTEGEPVMLPPSLAQETAERMYASGVQVLRPYLRFVTL